MSRLFNTADILIPVESTDMNKWSVVACDQHSSEPEYWDELDRFIGEAPSTLRLMLPEAYLDRDIDLEQRKINNRMDEYLEGGVFRTIEDSFIFVERTLADGRVRKGLVGAINLDEYDYSASSTSLIRATEGTVEERLPARVKIRNAASIEMPHVMVFIDDRQNELFDALSELSSGGELETLYDFELNMGGGHIKGSRVSGKAAKEADEILCHIETSCIDHSFSGVPVVMAIGDGNHSLATAKKCGAHSALVELVNIYDDAIDFQPIHRVVFNTEKEGFDEGVKALGLENISSYAEKIRKAEAFCQGYVKEHGGYVDYIHNDETALEMGSREGNAALLLPALNKEELFPGVEKDGAFPKKSFSIGHAADKRYYLECAKI